MIDYVAIQAVLDPAYFPRVLRQEADDDTILTHALDAYRMLNISQKLEEGYEVLELKNHSLNISSDIRVINMVTGLITNNGEVYSPSYGLGDNVSFIPLRYVGNRTINSTLHDYNNTSCKVCYHPELSSCAETWSLSIFKEMTTSIKDGWICIDYLKEAKDENGNFLIIKDPNILRFLGTYAVAMIWRDRDNGLEQGAANQFQKYLQMAEVLMKKAKGAMYQRNIDLNLLSSISGTTTVNQRLLRSPSFMYTKQDS